MMQVVLQGRGKGNVPSYALLVLNLEKISLRIGKRGRLMNGKETQSPYLSLTHV